MILIDTNVFLESGLNQDRAQECKELLEAVAEKRIEATVTHFTIHAVGAVLARGQRVLEFFRAIEGSLGLSVYDSSVSDELSAAVLSERLGRDFDDSLQYFVAVKIGAEAIISFDRHLDGLEIPRLEPSDVLANTKKLHSKTS